ncbi:radical SAM family heme chaperone HemW [Candidatus Pseudomonas adelgestsugas]|nr:radical SAM family heme chaperone HemW [Candidatus Pseudomonas adelgestsugas]
MTKNTASQPIASGGIKMPWAALPLLPPLALYIHIPWCVRKCPYCDFNSHTAHNVLPQEEYVNALLDDFAQDLNTVYNRKLTSIFFGGGTPSLFSAAALSYILKNIEAHIQFADEIEITLEVNPSTVEQENFVSYRKLGINRLSIGIQSFQKNKLQALGRIHDADEALRAVNMAHKAGFNNFNLDLIYGLPGQSLGDALRDLRQAIILKPTHLSWYQLTIEPNTIFWSQPPTLPEENTLWEIQKAGQSLLAKNGYTQYEVSAYAQSGYQAQHNLNYWNFGDFIGIGAGAHSKLSHPDGRIVRTWKTRMPNDYMNLDKTFQAGTKELTKEELPFEFLMNALRLTEGVDANLYTQRTNLDLDSLNKGRSQAEYSGLMQIKPSQLAATNRGQLFLNDLLQKFLN